MASRGSVIPHFLSKKDSNQLEITDTRIWELSNRIGLERIENDSRLGIKILGFITSEHFYRNDVLESMYVKEQYENNPDDGSYKGR